jgi:ubiquinol-cytochrome c reductase iron-sulfur subunit
VGGVGGLSILAPFFSSLRPSRRTQAAGAPVTVSLKDIDEGTMKVVLWRQKPIWILRRNEFMIESLENKNEENLLDPSSENAQQPEYCKNKTRSINPEYFVAVGLCTHLGCSPGEAKKGFLCACHGSFFDFAGRVVKGSPAPKNLFIPPHHYDNDGNIVIGMDASIA